MPYQYPFSPSESSESPTTVRDDSATETALSDSESRGELAYTAVEGSDTSNNTEETASAAMDCISTSDSETTSSASEAAATSFTRSSIRSSAPPSIQEELTLSTGNSSERTSRCSQDFLADVATSQAWLERNHTFSLDSMTSSPANTTKVKIASSTWGAGSAPVTAERSTSSSEERIRNIKLEMEDTLNLDFSILSDRESVSSDEQYTQEQTAQLGDVVSLNHLRYMRGESISSAEDRTCSHATDSSREDDTLRSGGSMADIATHHKSTMNATSNYRSPTVESVSDDMSSQTTDSARSYDSVRISAEVDSLVTSKFSTVSATSTDSQTRIAIERSRALMEEIEAQLKANQHESFGSADTPSSDMSTSEYASDRSRTPTSLCTATAITDSSEEYFNPSKGLPPTWPSTVSSDNDDARPTILDSADLPPARRSPVYNDSLRSRFDNYSSSDSGDGQSTIKTPVSSRTTSIWRLRGSTGKLFGSQRTPYISGPLHVEPSAAISVDNRYSTASEAITAHSTARTSQVSSFYARTSGRTSGIGSRSGSSLSSSEDHTVWSKFEHAVQSKFSRFGKKTGTYLDKAISRLGSSVAYNTVDRAFGKASTYSLKYKSGTSVPYDSTAHSGRDVRVVDTTGSTSPFSMRNWRRRR